MEYSAADKKKIANLYQKACNSPKNFAFSKAIKLARLLCGGKERSRGTSHHVFSRPDGGLFNLQNKKGQVTPYQVRQLVDYIEDNGILKEG